MKAAKRNIVIIIVAAVAVLAAAGVFLLWKPEPKGIIVGSSNLPDSLNPVLEQNVAGLDADELIFDGLVNFEVDQLSGKLYTEYALAEKIEQDPSTKMLYHVGLREVSWHDGTRFTADDVVYSFAAYAEPENKSPKRDYLLSFIKSVKKVDDRNVDVEFSKPIPPFRVFPVLTFKIIPSSYKGTRMSVNMRSGENERNFAIEPVGTGPFKLTQWEIGKWVNFQANGYYFKKRPEAASLVMKKVIDPVIRMNEFRKGRINLILETSPLDRPKVEKMPNVDINWYLPYAFYQVSINTKSPLFGNVDARKALSLSLERDKLVPGVTDRKEGVVINTGLFPSDIFTVNIPEYVDKPLIAPGAYDIDKARKLASSAGLTGKTAILLYPDSLGEFGQKMAEGIVAQFGALGITVEAKRTGDQVFKRLVFAEKSYDLALVYCDGFDNLYSSVGAWFRTNGESNISGIADEQLDKLFDDWDKAIVIPDWAALTEKIDQRVGELAPAVFLCKLEKDVYSRGIKDLVIVTDNPFLSVENWSLKG